MFLQSFALVFKWFYSRQLDISKSRLLTNCDEKLHFVNFKNGGTCVHRHILDIMLRISSNFFMAKLTDTSAYLGM